jgi:hypothetical protein
VFKKIIYFLALVILTISVNSCYDNSIAIRVAGNGCDAPNIYCGSPGIIKVQNGCPGDVQTIDLWAGVGNQTAGVLVGNVELYPVSGNTWKVKYVFLDYLYEASVIHFSIASTLSGIPQTQNGNPIPGQFQYKFDGPFAGGNKEFNITLPNNGEPPVNGYFVAAHAAGILGGMGFFNASIPDGCVTFSNAHHDFTQGSYFNFNLSNAGTFSGTWNGWCLDLAHVMQQNTTLNCAKMYSSLLPGTIPPQNFGFPYLDHPEDFDKLNYLINHFQVGQPVPPSSGCPVATGNLTVIDIQAVIWYLMDERPQNIEEWVNGPLADWEGLYSMDRIKAMLCDVLAHGEGFIPSCANNDVTGIIIIPDGQNIPFTVQPLLISIPCTEGGTEETAWGDGKYGGGFPGSNWATYFRWLPYCN